MGALFLHLLMVFNLDVATPHCDINSVVDDGVDPGGNEGGSGG